MKIRLIVPNVSNTSSKFAFAPQIVYNYGKEIGRIACGFTASQAIGGWVNDEGSLIVESVTVFDIRDNAAPESDYAKTRPDCFRELARQIADELDQECVYLEIDGNVEFVRRNN